MDIVGEDFPSTPHQCSPWSSKTLPKVYLHVQGQELLNEQGCIAAAGDYCLVDPLLYTRIKLLLSFITVEAEAARTCPVPKRTHTCGHFYFLAGTGRCLNGTLTYCNEVQAQTETSV